jgi:hypothetical protein
MRALRPSACLLLLLFGCSEAARAALDYVCGAKLPAQFVIWKKKHVYAHIDTSPCSFHADLGAAPWAKSPHYSFSVMCSVGTPPEGLVGLGSIMRPTTSGFQIVLSHPLKNAEQVRSSLFACEITWLGTMGKNSGGTPLGHTNWKHYSKNVIYADVDRDETADKSVYYSTALQGAASNKEAEYFLTHGGNIVYNPTTKGFRIYVEAVMLKGEVKDLASFAEKNKWVVSWACMSGVGQKEFQRTKWKRPDPFKDLFQFEVLEQQDRVLVPSLSVEGKWATASDPVLKRTNMFGKTGFLLCVTGSQLSLPTMNKGWHVRFMHYERRPCVVSAQLQVKGAGSEKLTTAKGQEKLALTIADVLRTPRSEVRFFNWKLTSAGFTARVVVRADNKHVSDRIFALLGRYAGTPMDHRFKPPLHIESVKQMEVDDGNGGSDSDSETMTLFLVGIIAFGSVIGWQTIFASIMKTPGGGVDVDAEEEVEPINSASPSKILLGGRNLKAEKDALRYVSAHIRMREEEEDKEVKEEQQAEDKGLFSIDLDNDCDKVVKKERRKRFQSNKKRNVRVVGGGFSIEESIGLGSSDDWG